MRNADQKIAVIGVHGVGAHVAGNTAEAIANQLLQGASGVYRGFDETAFVVPVLGRPLLIKPMTAELKKIGGRFGFNSIYRKTGNAMPGANPAIGGSMLPPADLPPEPKITFDAGLDFTQTLLDGGEEYVGSYSSTCWKGLKHRPGGGRNSVGIFEMYWSDLSHGGGVWQVVKQFLQLLIHLASIGRLAAASALKANPTAPAKTQRAWKFFYWLNAACYFLLSMPILLGNLWFLLLGLLFIVFIPKVDLAAGVTAGAIVALILGVVLMRRLHLPRKATRWPAIITGLAGVTIALLWLGIAATSPPDNAARILLVVTAAFALAGLGHVLAAIYELNRPGARLAFWIMFAIAALITVATAMAHIPDFPVAVSSIMGVSPGTGLGMIGWLYMAATTMLAIIAVSWVLWYLLALLLVITGFCAARRLGERDGWRVMYTGLVSTLLPAPLFLTVSIAFWALAQHIFVANNLLPMVSLKHWLPVYGAWGKVHVCAGMIQHMVESHAVPALFPNVAAALAGLILVVVGTLPSILAEIMPPQAGTNQTATQRLGNWLDGGFTALSVAAVIAGFGFLAAVLLDAVGWIDHNRFAQWQNDGWVKYMAVGATGTAATLLAATSMFAETLGGAVGKARVVIDTLQDVDNWLRERPVEETIRLQIFARYYALLSYIGQQGYKKVVIGAHSQGSVITADFLAYITAKGLVPPGISEISLLTYGSPLRQLYKWRLPYFYDWFGNGAPPLEKFGLKKWLNAYGSGDYVGRNFQKDNLGSNVSTVENRFDVRATNLTGDYCVGALAHTHYLDADNTVIRGLFDQLI